MKIGTWVLGRVVGVFFVVSLFSFLALAEETPDEAESQAKGDSPINECELVLAPADRFLNGAVALEWVRSQVNPLTSSAALYEDVPIGKDGEPIYLIVMSVDEVPSAGEHWVEPEA